MRIGSTLPARAGVGFKPVYFGEILATSQMGCGNVIMQLSV
jgi:hypothetical protein